MAAFKLNSPGGAAGGVRWGYALGWYGPFCGFDEDEYMSKLKFLKKYNFKCTHIGLDELDGLSEARKDAIFSYMAENDLDMMPIVGFNYLALSGGEAEREVERQHKLLFKYAPLLRGRICHTGLRAGHRFDGARPVGQTLDLLSGPMGLLAEMCASVGMPLCVENHGDYYVSDLVRLCQITPHLYIFLDTGNTYLLGEKPLPAFREAAPYVIGSHFKDQRVRPRPDASPLCFEVGNSDLGGGMVPLRECWDILRQYAPDPDGLTMMFEMFTPPGMDPQTCLDNSIAFVKSLEGSNL